jgi:bifunctional DNA primase/polymerase-like protein
MSTESTEIRLALWRNGYYVVPVSGPHLPITDAGKRPIIRNWKRQALAADERAIRRWAADEARMPNTGIYCRNVCAVDIDFDDPLLAEELAGATKRVLRGEPLVRIGQWPRRLLLYRCDTQIKTELFYFARSDNEGAHVDILGTNTQFVAFGMHPIGDPYRWIGPSPVSVAMRDLPPMTQSDVTRLEAAMIEVLGRRGYTLREVRQNPVLLHRIAASAYLALDACPRLRVCVEWMRPWFKKIMRKFEVRQG